MANGETCEECGKLVTNYWGYLSDFYPDFPPPRDRSKDMILYGIQEHNPEGEDAFHYYCSEEHQLLGWEKLSKN